MDDLQAFYGPNAGYVLELYDRYVQDPASVDPATRASFAHWMPRDGAAPVAAGPRTLSSLDAERVARVAAFARTIQARGHMAARLDPLGSAPSADPGLDPAAVGVDDADLAQLPPGIVGGPAAAQARTAGEAIAQLRRIYCQTTGYDFAHIQVAEERAWLQDAVETGRFNGPLDAASKRALLERLTEVEAFEVFLHRSYTGQKRFSIEGTDMLVPMLDAIIRDAAMRERTHDVVLGMAHRGRLNVLAHVLGKPYGQIFGEFQHRSHGAAASEHFAHYGWTGDVKYHLGARRTLQEGETIDVQITLSPNPSHLGFVNPVVQGMARALQETRDHRGVPPQHTDAALAILIHGDAAFPGEGVVAESLNLSQLAGYRIGGAVHIIANNQLGFTTDPRDGRSTLYASDLAKGFEIPIVHVNADDPEACMAAARLAYAYHQRFHKDFLIDLVGYRRWGHNEADEPAFTQPLMYEAIRAHPSVRALWARQLEQEGIVTAAEAQAMLDAGFKRLQAVEPGSEEVAEDQPRDGMKPPVRTAVLAEQLRAYNESLLQRPEGFTPNAKLERLLQNRRSALEPDGAIDWAHAESLALASLLADGTPVRLTGQDAERGTFSQRHLVLHDAVTGARYVPLQALAGAKAAFAVYNSPLSEMAALGFEYGYSGSAPEALVLWEAQYGDFANAGQVIIDQFISSARAKWRERPWLVLLLPHGYEGQGPEHSSGRLERYLQLAGGDNLRIANCTTAAQYFHLLRRQVALRDSDPRPLVVMTPKSLLRDKLAASTLRDLTDGAFQPVLDDEAAAGRRDLITRLVLCSGRVYVDLVKDAAREGADRVALVRVEELCPFPSSELATVLGSYPNLREIIWLQEEPRNMGAWSYMAPRLRDLIGREPSIDYIGRPERASPAEGSSLLHTAEQSRIIAEAFSSLQGPSPAVRGVRQHAG